MNDNVHKMPPVPPFVKFVAAAVPMVFDDSLSYYEALCALWKYISGMTDVINNNATLEEEYIAKFDELKEFVDHYFDNLDVQEEINNKLDEMVEDGTLESILLNYTLVTKVYDTHDDLVTDSANLVNGMKVKTLGYHTINDGGEADYYVTDTASTSEYQETYGSLYLTYIPYEDTFNVRAFGAVGDGTTDDYDVINDILKFISNNTGKHRYNIFFSDGYTYLIRQADLLDGCTNVITNITLSGASKLKFDDFTGNCFTNDGKMRFVEFVDLTFEGADDSKNKTLFQCTTNYSVQSLHFTNCFFSGKFQYVFNLNGAGNNSEFTFDFCYANMDSEWTAFINQGTDNTSDDALNFWFNNLRYLSNGALIKLNKGGHVKLDNCDFSHFMPTTDTYLFTLGYANTYGTSAFGVATFVDNNSRYELRNEHSKVIDCFWSQANVLFEGCDFSSSQNAHLPADSVYKFKGTEKNQSIVFRNCKMFGKFDTYAQSGCRSVISVENCLFYNVADIKDTYTLSKDNSYTNYFNIKFSGCKLYDNQNYINYTTNLFNNFITSNAITTMSNVGYNQSNEQAQCRTSDWKCEINGEAFVKSITFIPWINGNGTSRSCVIYSELATVVSPTVSGSDVTFTCATTRESWRFIKGETMLINDVEYTVSSYNNTTHAITLTTAGTPSVSNGDKVYLVLGKHNVKSNGNDNASVPTEITVNKKVYNDLKLKITSGQDSIYANIFVDVIN